MGEASARRRNQSTIDSALSGDVNAADVTSLHRQAAALLKEAPARFLIVNTSGITNFSPDVRVPGVPFLEDMKAQGIELVVAIAPSGLVRMMGSAIGLAARVRIRFVADLDEAERLIEKACAA